MPPMSPIPQDANAILAQMNQIAEMRRAEANANAEAQRNRDQQLFLQGQEFAQSLALQNDSQQFQMGENQRNRDFQAKQQESMQTFQGGQSALDRGAAMERLQYEQQATTARQSDQQDFQEFMFNLQAAHEAGIQALEAERTAAVLGADLKAAGVKQREAEKLTDTTNLLQMTMDELDRTRAGVGTQFNEVGEKLIRLNEQMKLQNEKINNSGQMAFQKIVSEAREVTASKSMMEDISRFTTWLAGTTADINPFVAKATKDFLRSKEGRAAAQVQGAVDTKEFLAVTRAGTMAKEYVRNMTPVLSEQFNGDLEKAGAATEVLGTMLAALSVSGSAAGQINKQEVAKAFDTLTNEYGLGRDSIVAVIDTFSNYAKAQTETTEGSQFKNGPMQELVTGAYRKAAFAADNLRGAIPGIDKQLLGRMNVKALQEAKEILKTALTTGQPIDMEAVLAPLAPSDRKEVEKYLDGVFELMGKAETLRGRQQDLAAGLSKQKGQAELAGATAQLSGQAAVADMLAKKLAEQQAKYESMARQKRQAQLQSNAVR